MADFQVSGPDLAGFLGVELPTVLRHVRADALPREASGLFDLRRVVPWLRAYERRQRPETARDRLFTA